MQAPSEDELAAAGVLARAAWPELSVADELLRSQLLRHAPLEALRLGELYLACACARGIPAAIEIVEARSSEHLGRSFARIRPAGLELDDARQLVRAKVFLGDRPKILEYSGRGDLAAWLRVVTVRALIDAARERHRQRDEHHAGDDAFGFADPADDPELGYLKQTYRTEFKAAFHAALAALSAADRNVLRFHLVKQLSIDEIGGLLRIHRATAARRIASARQAVIAGTRDELARRLQLSADELADLVGLIQSSIDVSLSRVLGSSHSPIAT